MGKDDVEAAGSCRCRLRCCTERTPYSRIKRKHKKGLCQGKLIRISENIVEICEDFLAPR